MDEAMETGHVTIREFDAFTKANGEAQDRIEGKLDTIKQAVADGDATVLGETKKVNSRVDGLVGWKSEIVGAGKLLGYVGVCISIAVGIIGVAMIL